MRTPSRVGTIALIVISMATMTVLGYSRPNDPQMAGMAADMLALQPAETATTSPDDVRDESPGDQSVEPTPTPETIVPKETPPAEATQVPTQGPTEVPAIETPEALMKAQGGLAASYIVRLQPGVSQNDVVRDRVGPQGGRVTQRFDAIINGFAVELPEQAVKALQQDKRVLGITPDFVVTASQQSIPKGIQRIGAHTNTLAKIDGVDERVDVDVAVLDTGVDPHPDLNVAGGVDCTGSGNFHDPQGHGTHVAGTIGALDNGVGVVGVAPGARIWSVKVLGADGSGKASWILCGIDWITKQGATIEIANMSLSGQGNPDDNNCGYTNGAVLHQAICASVDRGVTYVVAAGNSNLDAAGFFPAHYDEVITVSALADSDGKAGGTGSATSAGADDTLASFSNYGADVDVIAPGVSIHSTARGGGYTYMSGTSMASPHVAGAAALYKIANPGASPADVRAELIASGSTSDWSGDKDGFKEPVIGVSGFGATQKVDRAVVSVSAPGSVQQGTTATVTATVSNFGSASEAIAVTLVESPNGFTQTMPVTVAAGGTASVSFSWTTSTTTTAGAHTLTVTVPTEGDSNAANNKATATTTIEAAALPPGMSVNSMTLASAAVSGGYKLTSVVNVRSNGANVNGAAVMVDVTLPNGTKQSQTATSDSSGNASFYLTVTATGTYTVTVTNVAKSGSTYDASKNAVTSKTITVGSTSTSGAMSVSNITVSSSAVTGGTKLTMTVYVVSGTTKISGASVTLKYTDPNGSTTSQTASTNISGYATFSRTVSTSGTYTVAVTNVTKSGSTYDASKNAVTSKSITVGSTSTGSEASCLNATEAAFLKLINDYRASNGLKALTATKSLNTAAHTHSLDMGQKNLFSHTGSDGSSFTTRMSREGYTYSTSKGENIAAGHATAQKVFDAWKASSGHNANMLNANYKAIGIGFVHVSGSKYTYYWTTDFGGYVDATATCS